MFMCSEWYLKSNPITGEGVFLIIEGFQLVSEKGVVELDYLISKLLNKASPDNQRLCKSRISLWTEPNSLTVHSHVEQYSVPNLVASKMTDHTLCRHGIWNKRRWRTCKENCTLSAVNKTRWDSFTHICVPIFKCINYILTFNDKGEKLS